jgi:hypothetical protein
MELALEIIQTVLLGILTYGLYCISKDIGEIRKQTK